MDKALYPLTKLVLAIWALVTAPGGLLLLFYEPFATSVVWPPPLAPIPRLHAQFNGAIGVGTGIASLLALRQNRWSGAQPLIGLYVVYAIFAEYTALTYIAANPAPFQLWFYVVLGVFYLVASFVIWRRQS